MSPVKGKGAYAPFSDSMTGNAAPPSLVSEFRLNSIAGKTKPPAWSMSSMASLRLKGRSWDAVELYLNLGDAHFQAARVWASKTRDAVQGIEPGFLIQDADTKFSPSLDSVWASEGAGVIQIPHRVPDPNTRMSSSASAAHRSTTSCVSGCAITSLSARIVDAGSGTLRCKSIMIRPFRRGQPVP